MTKGLKPLTSEEMQLAGRLLELAAAQYARHGCNDMEDWVWGDVAIEKRKDLSQQYHNWNGDPEEGGDENMEDWLLMTLLSEKLKAVK